MSGDAARCLTVVDELAQQGFDLAHVAKDVLRHLRDLVVAKVCGEDGRRLLDLADEEARDVYELAARTEADDLSRLFQGFSRGFDEIARSGQPRTVLEMTLVRLARRPALIPIDELLVRLGDMEKRLGGGSPTPPRSGGAGPSPRGSGGSANSKGAAMAQPWATSAKAEPTTHGSLALAVPHRDEEAGARAGSRPATCSGRCGAPERRPDQARLAASGWLVAAARPLGLPGDPRARRCVAPSAEGDP